MTIETVGGRVVRPPRLLVYGPPKVGKTTFAAEAAEDPLSISVEGGDLEMDLRRFVFDKKTLRTIPSTMEEIKDATVAVGREKPCKTLIYDGLNAIEQICATEVCKKNKWQSLSDPGYGKGETALLTEMRVFLKLIESEVWTRGIGVTFTAHSKLGKVRNPEGDEYQRHEPALVSANNADIGGLFVGWCDAVVFARHEIETAKLESKRVLGVSTGRRLLHTEEGAAGFVAGCRYGNVDPVMELSGAEFRRQVEEGQNPDRMRARIAKLAETASPERAARVTEWLTRPESNNLSALVRAANALKREVANNQFQAIA